MASQSNLERISKQVREEQLVRSTYSTTNQYSAQHPDALSPNTPNATGEEKGKGMGTSMGALSLTHTKSPNSPINYNNVNTLGGGSTVDIQKRNEGFVRNLYSPTNQYGVNSIDETININDGQVIINW